MVIIMTTTVITTPQNVANFFLDKGKAEDYPITTLKLLKLVYLGYAWYLWDNSEEEKRLFDEPILAWTHGPVIPSLYHEFKNFQQNPINRRSVDFNFITLDDDYQVVSSEENCISETEAKNALGFVWETYKTFSAWSLRNMTHGEGGPWSKVYSAGKNEQIKDTDIIEYYAQKAKEYGLTE